MLCRLSVILLAPSRLLYNAKAMELILDKARAGIRPYLYCSVMYLHYVDLRKVVLVTLYEIGYIIT
jgi:hypothetical protein